MGRSRASVNAAVPARTRDGARLAWAEFVSSCELIGRVAGISRMSDDEFREFELDLVRLYRTDPGSQEGVVVALTVADLQPANDTTTRTRLTEIFGMLQHVHDPFVTGSAQNVSPSLPRNNLRQIGDDRSADDAAGELLDPRWMRRRGV